MIKNRVYSTVWSLWVRQRKKMMGEDKKEGVWKVRKFKTLNLSFRFHTRRIHHFFYIGTRSRESIHIQDRTRSKQSSGVVLSAVIGSWCHTIGQTMRGTIHPCFLTLTSCRHPHNLINIIAEYATPRSQWDPHWKIPKIWRWHPLYIPKRNFNFKWIIQLIFSYNW